MCQDKDAVSLFKEFGTHMAGYLILSEWIQIVSYLNVQGTNNDKNKAFEYFQNISIRGKPPGTKADTKIEINLILGECANLCNKNQAQLVLEITEKAVLALNENLCIVNDQFSIYDP